jgi:hypothetical protein
VCGCAGRLAELAAREPVDDEPDRPSRTGDTRTAALCAVLHGPNHYRGWDCIEAARGLAAADAADREAEIRRVHVDDAAILRAANAIVDYLGGVSDPTFSDIDAARAVLAALGEATEPEPKPPPTRCEGTLGSRPWWMGVDQYDPCRCDLPFGHDGEHQCKHTRQESSGEATE